MSGAVTNRSYRIWAPKIWRKNGKLNDPGVYYKVVDLFGDFVIYSCYDLNPISERSAMRKQTHKVELTSEERQTLETLVRKGEHSALKLMRAHILLKADRNGPSWTDAQISEAFGTAMRKLSTMFANGLPRVRDSLPWNANPKVDRLTCQNLTVQARRGGLPWRVAIRLKGLRAGRYNSLR